MSAFAVYGPHYQRHRHLRNDDISVPEVFMYLTRILVCALLLGSTPGRAQLPQAPMVEPKQAVPFQVFMQLDLHPQREVGQRSLLPGEIAHTGDKFGIKVWTDRAVYLYVISFSKDGWSRRLFPDSGHNRVTAGDKISLPVSGNLYRLHDPPEENTLYLFASLEPIDAVTCAMLRLSCADNPAKARTRGSNAGSKEPPPPPPPAGKTAREREGKLLFDAQERFVSVKSNEKGSALLRFSFKQEP